MKLHDILLRETKKVTDPLNISIVELRSKESKSGLNINIIIEKEGGITLDDCEKVTRLLNDRLAILDEIDTENYRLQVSSPGLSRVFKSKKEYEIFKSRPVIVYLEEPIENFGREVKGILEGLEGDKVKIKDNSGQILLLELKKIKKTKLNG